MRTCRFVPLLALALEAGCASQGPYQAAQDTLGGGPKPDAHLRMTTTSISPEPGLSWADAWLSFNNTEEPAIWKW